MDMWKQLRYILKDKFNALANFEVYSIWQTRSAERRREYLAQQMIKDWFPLCYWFMVIYSFLGLTHQVAQFLRVRILRARPLRMWRGRVFCGVRDCAIRQLRVWGSFAMIACWLLLFCGLFLNKPKYMMPWLRLSKYILILDLAVWFLELIFGCDRFTWQTLLSFGLLGLCQALMANLKKVLDEPNHHLFDM